MQFKLTAFESHYIPDGVIFCGLAGGVVSDDGAVWLSERSRVSRRLFSELSDGDLIADRAPDVMDATVCEPNADADGVGGVDESSLSAGPRTNS